MIRYKYVVMEMPGRPPQEVPQEVLAAEEVKQGEPR
jgi:hypothetical protein